MGEVEEVEEYRRQANLPICRFGESSKIPDVFLCIDTAPFHFRPTLNGTFCLLTAVKEGLAPLSHLVLPSRCRVAVLSHFSPYLPSFVLALRLLGSLQLSTFRLFILPSSSFPPSLVHTTPPISTPQGFPLVSTFRSLFSGHALRLGSSPNGQVYVCQIPGFCTRRIPPPDHSQANLILNY